MSARRTCALIFSAPLRLTIGTVSNPVKNVVGASCSTRFRKMLSSPLQKANVETISELCPSRLASAMKFSTTTGGPPALACM